MQQSARQHQARLHKRFTAALDLLDRQNREPDRWEEECLSYALGAMACGLYSAAEVELSAFSRPVAERLAEEVALLEEKPSRFTKEMLRHGFDYVVQRNLESSVTRKDMPMPPAGHLAVRTFLGASL